MCLIALAWQTQPDHPLVLVANRDEFYARPAAPARFWEDSPDLLAGRDLSACGTWLGLTRHGRFAALTNVREPGRPQGEKSRGLLVSGFLQGEARPLDYLQAVAAEGGDYSGFNLLVGDREELAYYSNRMGPPRLLPPGVHGVSNASLDVRWPKVHKSMAALQAQLNTPLDPEALLRFMQDDSLAPDAELPHTGVSQDMERLLSACFIRSPIYGTRCTTALVLGAERARLVEQSYEQGELGERADFSFALEPV